MDNGFRKKIVAILYVILIIFFIIIGFAYSNQENSKFYENYREFTTEWTVDGIEIELPYSNRDEFEMTNTLPQVYGDQYLIIKCYYDTASVFVDGVEVYRSRDNWLFGSETNVGKKELHIPMKVEYSGKTITARIKLQNALYGAEIYDCLISTRSGYGIAVLKKEAVTIMLSVILLFTGITETLIAIHFIIKKSLVLRRLSFEALLFAGLFSILSGVWLFTWTRLPYIVFGNSTGFAILEIVSFMLLPLVFFELVRAVNFRVSKTDNIIDGVFAMAIVLCFILCLIGVCDWGDIVVIAHVIDIAMIFVVAYYSYTSIKAEKRKSERRLIAIGNSLFLLVCVVALAMYINNIDSNFNIFVIIGLMIYISTQIGLIYRRLGLKVEEEAELVQVKELAYTDELTKLTNRRYFYEELAAIEDKEPSPDTTIIYFDVNRLKYTNDTLGHDAGDELLVGAADCIKKAFGGNSTSVISRMGGDEFIAMLIISQAELVRRLDTFKKLTAEYKGQYINEISVSVGVASRREHPNADINGLCGIADDNMYAAKKDYYTNSGFERRSGR
ncbi:GGDEF domain-containing protein [Pseudobutyrivibrio xylanivorans]|uniref:GGDEF domain-containing protein n=1 Tax=Pseudobutyrivibrio xylanivorans TaxID=185007 RepID=A0A5P6VVG9_PSEXY|nr:GGDEF domain-containing protein [Pseudobutyrivibrio xylanivorans]QFJ55414.1 GGDEF domain-containing protein [Pseudobutyrivibrio xylanivorans]